MGVKLQELTEKIYNEGVEKAQKEAEQILTQAHAKAKSIEEAAKTKAEKMISEAQLEVEKLKEQVGSELKMSIDQSLTALKQNLTNAVTMHSVQPAVKELFENGEFLKALLLKMVEGWVANDTMDMKLVLSEKERTQMEKFFKNQLAKELNAGLELSFSEGVKSGFKVGPTDGSYEISFTESDFTNFFSTYLRPKTAEILFEEK